MLNLIILNVFAGSMLVEAWAQQTATICMALAPVFIAINLGKNYASWIVESDMSINIKNIGVGLVYFVAIMNYNELAGAFTEMLMSFAAQFGSAEFFSKVGHGGRADVQVYLEAMKKMFDDLVPLGAGTFFNGLGRMIRPVVEMVQIVSIAILYITGPIALVFSILLDSSVFKKWLNALIVVIFWSITMNLLETVSIGLNIEIIAKLNDVNMTDTGIMANGLFFFVVQIMYLMVPFLTAKYINISTVGGIGGKLMAVTVGAAAMATKVGTGAASMGGAMGGTKKGITSLAGGGGAAGGSAPNRNAASSSASSINNAITKQK